MYHRVIETDSDPWSLCVSPQNFAAHLEVLRRYTQPIPLTTLNQSVKAGKRLPRRVVLTFDDGYLDNLKYAKPLLEQYEIPATVFVASGYLGENREFWWDELEKFLLQPGQLPETLTLNINGTVHSWHLGNYANYSDSDFLRYRSWSADDGSYPTPRHSLYVELHRLLRTLSERDRRPLMDHLSTLAGNPQPEARNDYRPLTRDEVQTLDQGDWVKVGVHTTTHPLLELLPIEQQKEEIQRCKAELEALLKRPITTFAYPYGNYSEATPDLVRDLGFSCACTTNSGDVRPRSDRFQLHRMGVCNWTGEEFARQLKQWF
ncbi:MAG TPA: polysaccharide deacetylase family protein [Chroococcidiopsis sp.]